MILNHESSLVHFFLPACQSPKYYNRKKLLCSPCLKGYLLWIFTQTENVLSYGVILKDTRSQISSSLTSIRKFLLYYLAWSSYYWNNLCMGSESQATISGRCLLKRRITFIWEIWSALCLIYLLFEIVLSPRLCIYCRREPVDYRDLSFFGGWVSD